MSTKCAHHSPCPVVIVPKAGCVAASDPGRTRRIVVGVDGSERSLRALRWAVEDAQLRGWSIEAVAVWRDHYSDETGLGFHARHFRRDRPAHLKRVEGQLAEAVTDAVARTPM